MFPFVHSYRQMQMWLNVHSCMVCMCVCLICISLVGPCHSPNQDMYASCISITPGINQNGWCTCIGNTSYIQACHDMKYDTFMDMHMYKWKHNLSSCFHWSVTACMSVYLWISNNYLVIMSRPDRGMWCMRIHVYTQIKIHPIQFTL